MVELHINPSMVYRVLVVDNVVNQPIIVDASVNARGISVILETMTDLTLRERGEFTSKLYKDGHNKHLSKAGDAKRFTISVVRK